MKKEIMSSKKYIEAEMKQRKVERDGDNRVIINMTVRDDDDFLASFSEFGDSIISSDVSEFIENSTQLIFPNEALALHIHSNCIDENEKREYRKAIKEYYVQKYISDKKKLKKNALISLALALCGILILGFAIFMDIKGENPIWTEFIDIIAWVLVWEAVDIFVFRNRDLRINCRRYVSYFSMKVEYFPLPTEACRGNKI